MKSIAALFLGVIATSVAAASREVQQLANDKMSILDYGLYRLDTALQQELLFIYKPQRVDFYVTASYNASEDKLDLLIDADFLAAQNLRVTSPSDACKQIVSITKEQLRIRPRFGADASSWIEFFRHSEQENITDQLASVLPTLLRINVSVQAFTGNGVPTKCISMYLEQAIQVVR